MLIIIGGVFVVFEIVLQLNMCKLNCSILYPQAREYLH